MGCNPAVEHDRVTNGSKIVQTQQYPSVYHTNLTIGGHSTTDFEVIACSFLSVHASNTMLTREIQRKIGKKERKGKRKRERRKKTMVAAELSF